MPLDADDPVEIRRGMYGVLELMHGYIQIVVDASVFTRISLCPFSAVRQAQGSIAVWHDA